MGDLISNFDEWKGLVNRGGSVRTLMQPLFTRLAKSGGVREALRQLANGLSDVVGCDHGRDDGC